MSDTPRTDREELCTTDYILPTFVVTSDICRELERENQQLRKTALSSLNQQGQKELVVAWDRIRELERENAALREDKERMEWSEQFLHHVSEVVKPKTDGTRFVGQYRDSTGRGTRWMIGRSFRDCIDAAREEAQP